MDIAAEDLQKYSSALKQYVAANQVKLADAVVAATTKMAAAINTLKDHRIKNQSMELAVLNNGFDKLIYNRAVSMGVHHELAAYNGRISAVAQEILRSDRSAIALALIGMGLDEDEARKVASEADGGINETLGIVNKTSPLRQR